MNSISLSSSLEMLRGSVMTMRKDHPMLFGTLLGGAIGAAIGLGIGIFEASFLYWMERGVSQTKHPYPYQEILLIAILTMGIVAIGCALLGALTGVFATSNVFGKRGSVLGTGFLVGGIGSVLLGAGLQPLGGPLMDRHFLRDPMGIVIALGLIGMMASHLCWPHKEWARVASAVGVAAWILFGLAVTFSSV